MPHFSFEYSANVQDRVNPDDICTAIHAAAIDSGLFELGAIRVRGFRADTTAIADRLDENGFLHLTVSVGAGRSVEARQAAGEVVWAALTGVLAPVFETPHFALTMEWREIDPLLSWKKNAIHPRLRAAKET